MYLRLSEVRRISPERMDRIEGQIICRKYGQTWTETQVFQDFKGLAVGEIRIQVPQPLPQETPAKSVAYRAQRRSISQRCITRPASEFAWRARPATSRAVGKPHCPTRQCANPRSPSTTCLTCASCCACAAAAAWA